MRVVFGVCVHVSPTRRGERSGLVRVPLTRLGGSLRPGRVSPSVRQQMDEPGWEWKWLFDKTTGKAVQFPCRRAARLPNHWLVNVRPGCERSKVIEVVPVERVYDSEEDALGANSPHPN